MTYQSTLPQIFPYVIYVTRKEANELIGILTSADRTDVPNGSSFALTVDGYLHGDGYWRLWLSRASADHLYDCFKEGLWKNKWKEEDPIKWASDRGLGE